MLPEVLKGRIMLVPFDSIVPAVVCDSFKRARNQLPHVQVSDAAAIRQCGGCVVKLAGVFQLSSMV